MKRSIITTSDGSKTIYLTDWDEHYHSKHGAIQEANHVFIEKGLRHFCNSSTKHEISILEMGFGTGLNALVSLLEAEQLNKTINYVGVEAYPISKSEMEQLNYTELIAVSDKSLFNRLHDVPWGIEHQVTSNFILTKNQQFFSKISDTNVYDIIYFDAFGARVQPELWTEDIFKAMHSALQSNGILVTYSAKGSVKRAMQSVGFSVERLDGPPGKRHMLRATK